MDKNKQIQKVPEYPVGKLTGKSNLLIRGLQELGLIGTILRLISNGDVKIPALDGSRIFSFEDGEIFKYVFFDMKGLDKNEIPQKSDETELLVYKLVRDANIYKMFSSLGRNFEQLCLTQNQILEFLDKYQTTYSNGGTYHFLFKSNDKIYVAQICVDSVDSMRLFGGQLTDDDIHGMVYNITHPANAEMRFRVIVPK